MMTIVVGTMSVDSYGAKEGKAEIVEAHCTLKWEKQQKAEVGDCHPDKHSECTDLDGRTMGI